MPWTEQFLDDFNTDPGVDLEIHDSRWVKRTSGTSAYVHGTQEQANSGTSLQRYSLDLTLGDDQAVSAVAVNWHNQSTGLALRHTHSGTGVWDWTGYLVWGRQNDVRIFRVDNGTLTQIASATPTTAQGDVLRGEVEGTTVRLFRNGGLELQLTDGNYSAGDVGWYTAQVGIFLDDFRAFDQSVAATGAFSPVYRPRRR